MKDTMTVTVDTDKGTQAYFTIEFNKSDFFDVVDAVGNLSLDSVQNSPLWKVV